MFRSLRWVAVLSCLLALGTFTGCQKQITADYVRDNMSPGLHSMAESKQQSKNRHARMLDTNLRQIPDDVDYIMLWDRPLRLSPYVIP